MKNKEINGNNMIDESTLRNKMQNINAEKSELRFFRKMLAELELRNVLEGDDAVKYNCCLVDMLDELLFSASVILSDSGYNLEYSVDAYDAVTACSPRMIITVILEMISSCLKSSNSVNLEISETSDYYIISAGIASDKYAERCAALHCGAVYNIISDVGSTMCMSIKKEKNDSLPFYINDDFTDYICNRLSPLYIGLSDYIKG